MPSAPELSALLEQATRNLETLERLVLRTGGDTASSVCALRQRLHELKLAYTSETEVLTQQMLTCALERDGRHPARDCPSELRAGRSELPRAI